MGISISMKISKSVTKEEWEKVYEEVLMLVNKLPFAERRRIKIHDIDTYCLVQTKERTENYGWEKENSRTGWCTDGDYICMHTAESYFLPRDLVKQNIVEPDAGDAILGNLAAYLDYEWNDDICNHTYSIWGGKTQGETYHMYLLAVACLIEARLGEKAMIFGDITRGQCRKAVELANTHLQSSIELPDRCCMERLFRRVSILAIPADKKIELFDCLYLGTKDIEYGEFIREMFSEEYIDGYWKRCFQMYESGMLGWNDYFHQYLTQGFGLEKLCEYVPLQDKEGIDKHKNLVIAVMDTKMHLVEKNCKDTLSIDPEEERLYGIWTLLAQFCFAGAKNKKVDRYIPIEDIRKALMVGLKQYNDVNQIIDEYLEKEASDMKIDLDVMDNSSEKFISAVKQDSSEVLNQIMDKRMDEYNQVREKYDIYSFAGLKFFEKGDTVSHNLEKSLGEARLFLDSLLEKDELKKLQGESAHTKCRWLIDNNNYLLIRDKDWEKIFTDIENNDNSFGRYYSIMRVKMDNHDLVEMCIALIINDDLYDYSKILANRIIFSN